MTFLVEISATAKAEAEMAYEWLKPQSPMRAINWFNGLADAVESLIELPNRWPLAPENAGFDEPIRQMLYGKSPHIYRVLFIVRDKTVFVLISGMANENQ